MANKYSKEEEEVIRHYYPMEGFAGCKKRLSNRSIEGIKSKAKAMGIKSERIQIPSDIANNEIDISFLVKENDRLKEILKKEKIKTEIFLEKAQVSISKIKFFPPKIPKIRHVKHDIETHLLHGDTQVGSFVKPQKTQGIGNYNFEIYKKRMENMKERLYCFWEQDHDSLGLNKMVLVLIGDMVEGEGQIYNKQSYDLEFGITDQVFRGIEVEVNFINFLAGLFPQVEIFAIPGNHGRVFGGGENDSWDYMFYKILQMCLIGTKNVKMFVSESPGMLVKHGDFNFMYSHSANAKSWNSIPFYGLDRAAMRINALYDMIIDYLIVGHFHEEAKFRNVIVNGTVVGGSPLSINKMNITSVPSQLMFYFDKCWGINRQSTLILDEIPAMRTDDNGIYTRWS